MLLGVGSVRLVQFVRHLLARWGGSVGKSSPRRMTLPLLIGERRRHRLVYIRSRSHRTVAWRIAAAPPPPPLSPLRHCVPHSPCPRDIRASAAGTVSSPSSATDAQQDNGTGDALLQSVPAVFEFGGCANASPLPAVCLQSVSTNMRSTLTSTHIKGLCAGRRRVSRCAASVKWMIPIRSRRAYGKLCM